jgi:hypothetical protein
METLSERGSRWRRSLTGFDEPKAWLAYTVRCRIEIRQGWLQSSSTPERLMLGGRGLEILGDPTAV